MRPVVEILYFAGCPHYALTESLVRKIGTELGINPDLRLVEVTGEEEAKERRFLGSPTVRVGGRDIEPDADARTDYVFGCRVYRVGGESSGLPGAELIRAALTAG